ncbi:MAG: hypothetical protein RL596_1704 [Bacteroidota bacterium]|jgi:hypothetical protein
MLTYIKQTYYKFILHLGVIKNGIATVCVNAIDNNFNNNEAFFVNIEVSGNSLDIIFAKVIDFCDAHRLEIIGPLEILKLEKCDAKNHLTMFVSGRIYYAQ